MTRIVVFVLLCFSQTLAWSADSARIVGGADAPQGAYPWTVALLKSDVSNPFSAQFCGGSLIRADLVLTAAHCVENMSNSESIDVVTGVERLGAIKADQRISVESILVHPDYFTGTLDNDIALLRLSRDSASAVLPLIDSALMTDIITNLSELTVMGWGALEEDASYSSFPDTLQYVYLPYVDFSVCNSALGHSLTENMFCAGLSVGGVDSCQGDSGGPIVYYDSNRIAHQVGVVSWGLGCAQAGSYGVYTKVLNYVTWVNDNLDSMWTSTDPGNGGGSGVDDIYEPNNALLTASPLTEQVAVNGVSGDEDWYEISVTRGGIVLDLLFSHASSDLDVFLMNEWGNVITQGTGVTDDERIEYSRLPNGTYYIRVITYGAYNFTSYQLWWEDVTIAGVDDSYEPNNTLAGAAPLVVQTQVNGISSDEDWYAINVTTAGISVDLTHLHADADLDLSLFSNSGDMVTVSASFSDNERIDYSGLAIGTYYLAVTAYGSYNGATYQLVWEGVAAPGGGNSVDDDTYEPNNDLASAFPLDALTRIDAISSDNDDWYEINATNGGVVADLTHSHADSDLDLYLLDSFGFAVDSGISFSDNERIEYSGLPGTYYVVVVNRNYSSANYQLRWENAPGASSGGNNDDIYEPNDTLNEAAPLPADTVINALSANEDWYALDIVNGTVVIESIFDHLSADIDMRLLDAQGVEVAQSITESDNERIELQGVIVGIYYLQVVSYGSYSGASYQLWWQDTVVNGVNDDAYEPNNRLLEAAPLLAQVTAKAISMDEDWYEIKVVNETATVELTFVHAAADLDLYLLDNSGNRLASSNSTTDNERMELSGLQSGTYYLQVRSEDTYNGAGYKLWWNGTLTAVNTDSPATTENGGGAIHFAWLVVLLLYSTYRSGYRATQSYSQAQR